MEASDVFETIGSNGAPIGPPGRWLRVGFLLNQFNAKAPQFVPPKVLPDVKNVPGCVSALSAGQPTYVPASARPGSGTLPATGGALLALGLAVVAAGVIVRETRNGVRSPG